jgi:nitroreductase
MIEQLVKKNRSYRRFYEDYRIKGSILEDLVDLARLSPSGGNLQALKYVIVNDQKNNEEIFKCLKWAGYLKNWDGPEDGEKPAAYIIMLGDKDISKNFSVDQGIACQSILLGACEKGLGGCMLGAIDRHRIRELYQIPERYDVLLVIALGKPKEEVVINEICGDQDIKYWRDDNGIHHVPKRKLSDIILKLDKKKSF